MTKKPSNCGSHLRHGDPKTDNFSFTALFLRTIAHPFAAGCGLELFVADDITVHPTMNSSMRLNTAR